MININKKCNHKRIKRNYPFGRKSKAVKICKDCGKLISNKELSDNRRIKLNRGKKNVGRTKRT
jgi:hypothetical protein